MSTAKTTKCLNDLRGAVAAWVLGLLVADDLPEIATVALLAGADNSWWRQLAGQSSPLMVEASDLLQRALEEDGEPIPDKRSAALRYASCVSRSILARTITPYDGARAIWRVSTVVDDASFHDLDPFVYAFSELEDRPADKQFFENVILKEAAQWANRSEPPN
jgi:hypothetical protein